MRKCLIYIFGAVLFLACQSKSLAQFPYQNAVVSGDDFLTFIGEGGNVVFTNQGAILSDDNNSSSQTKGFYLNDLSFTVDRGFVIGFDYLMTGKGGGMGFGDGMALVLLDGSVENVVMGALGSGLGYSYRRSNVGSENRDGLTKGFLSVGLDLYGNFKNRMNLAAEYRNGIPNAKEKNHIVIRGQGNLKEGYPVLISQSTTDITNRYKLDITTGDYNSNFKQPDAKGFDFRLRETFVDGESDINASFGHSSYRRVIVSMFPGTSNSTIGFYLNVDVIHGSETSRVISDYFIARKGNIKYAEVVTYSNSNVVEKVFEAPNTIKLGFVAATGGAKQKHIVRNISVYLPFSPSVRDVLLDNVCKDIPTEIDILATSVGFDGNSSYSEGDDMHSLGKQEYLEPYSFRFRKLVNGIYEDTAEPFISVTDNGTYEYNPETKKAVFTPNSTGVTSATDQVYFTIKNKNTQGSIDYGNEQYRSDTATVKLAFGDILCNDILMVNGNSI